MNSSMLESSLANRRRHKPCNASWVAAGLFCLSTNALGGVEYYEGKDHQKLFEARFTQLCNKAIPATTPTEQFIDNKDGSVTDTKSGLTWMRCTLGQQWDGKTCTGDYLESTWQEALQATERLNKDGGFAGHQDWRMPNIKELNSILELACYAPTINLEVFPGTSNWYYWSSTPSMGVTEKPWTRLRQWGIDFHNGNHMPSNFSKRRARLVRD